MRASLHTSMTLSFIGEAISRLRNNLKISDIFPPFLVQAKDKVASSYRTHFLTLSFTSKELEKEYQTHYAIRNLLQVRFAMTLGVILYSAFGVLDIWIIPEVK